MDEETLNQMDATGAEIPAQSAGQEDSLPSTEQPQDGQQQEAQQADNGQQDGVQKRFNEMTAEKWQLRRDLQERDARLQELENKLQQLESQPAQQPAGATDQEPTRDNFYSDDEYFRAVADHRAKAAARAEIAQLRQDQERQSTQTEINRRKQETQRKLADGALKIEQEFGLKPGEFRELVFEKPLPFNFTPQMHEAFQNLSDPALFAYHLAKNPNLGFELVSIQDPVAVAVKMGQIQAQAKSGRRPEPRAVTEAAEPVTPVTPGTGKTRYTMEDYAKMPMNDFIRTIHEENAGKY